MHGNQFQHWVKVPSLQMNGKGLLEHQLKQFSIDALNKIRAQAALAPHSVTSLAQNQF